MPVAGLHSADVAGKSTNFSTERKMKILVLEDEICH
jgi:hypothetical protein